MTRRGSWPFRLFGSRALAVATLVVLVVGVLPSGVARAGNGNANLQLGKTVGSVAVSPQLSLTLAVNKPDAIPGDVLTYTGVVANTGATLTLAGTLVASNTNATTATIASYWDVISTNNKAHCGAGGSNDGKDTSQWPAFVGTAAAQTGYSPVSAAPIALGMTLVATPQAAEGVSYPAASATDQILGTVLSPGATATWQYTATIPLTTAQLAFLSDPASVTRIRNSFHAEPTPRSQKGNGQPDQINVDFCAAFNAADTSGAASDVTVTITLPDGTTRTIDKAAVPGLASIAPGASVSVTTAYTVPVPAVKGASETDAAYIARLGALNGSMLTASATAQTGASGPAAGPTAPVNVTEHLPVLTLTKTGPATVDAGQTATYDLGLSNAGSAAATPSLADTLPDGTVIAVTGVPAGLAPKQTATAHAGYAVPITQAAGDLTDSASLRWNDGNGNSYGPIGASATTAVIPAISVAHLDLSPQVAGPLPLGASHTLTITATNASGNPVPNVAVTLSLVGPNARSVELTTDAAGRATYSYSGSSAGTDNAQAVLTATPAIASNTATVLWAVPVVPVTTTTVHARFFPSAEVNTDDFTATPGMTPLWEQDFPNISFDPVDGKVKNDKSGVTTSTRPFTDVTTDLAGNYSGTIVAQGNGYQAGVGSLVAFDAAFTGTFVIAEAGDYQFDFLADDGFIFGIRGATSLPGGVMYRCPASGLTVFEQYPVMGCYQHNTPPIANKVLVHFPAPGTYPYELDYMEVYSGSLSLNMTMHSTGLQVAPMGSIGLLPQKPGDAQRGIPQIYTASVLGVDGLPLAGLPVTLNVSGVNATQLTAVTNDAGLATFTYNAVEAGLDELQAFAYVGEYLVISNTVRQTWTTNPPWAVMTDVSPADGSIITGPTPIKATLAPPPGTSIDSWSVAYQASGAPHGVTFGSGSGTPPETLGILDPTVLTNGLYTISVNVLTNGGRVSWTGTFSVVVEGNLKLGRYGVTYQDANIAVGGIPIQVLRTYDSFDKSKGDFGVGWQLGVANFRVYTNGSLGDGGWTQYPKSCFAAGLGGGLCVMGWITSRPHYVTVVWPDGHPEVFDFTPTDSSNLFWQSSAAFTARAGSTSKLEALGTTTVSYYGFGSLYTGMDRITVYNPTQFRLTAKDGTVYELDTTAGLTKATDRAGNTLTVDATGIHSSLGPSITFVRDSAGRITEMDKPDGSKVLYAYNAAGDLASVTDERGYTVTYEYDASHNLTKTIDPNGHPLRTLTYWPDGRLKTVTDGEGNTTSISVDPNARIETVTGPDPRLTTVTSMNERGDIVQVDQTFGGKTLTTKFTYDDFGHVLSKTDPLGHTTRATYNAAGSPLTLTEADGGTWQFAYNDHEQLTSVTDRTGRQVASLEYDSYGELIKKTTADGDSIYTYGSAGLLASRTDPLGHTTSFGYDSSGHVTTVTGPDGRVWRYDYDSDGRTKSVTDPAGDKTAFAYDLSGNLAGFTDAAGHGQSYTYDALGRLASATDGLGHTTTYSYDGASRLASVLDRNGQTTSFGYDAAGHVTSATLPDGKSLTYTYDPLGELVEADDADARLTFTYDAAGGLASQTSAGTPTSDQPSVTLSLSRDAAGRPTKLVAPWGTIGFGYDANGLLDSVTDPSGGKFTLGYDPLGRLASLTRPNGVDDTYTYDAAGELRSRTSSKGGAVIDALGYTYDSSGRVATKTNSAGTTTYGYDDADRLISVLAPAGSSLPSETFSYDGAGNQTQAGQTYDAANRLLSDSRCTYTYDGEGNQTSRTERPTGKVTTFAWNALHELTSATLPDGTLVIYRYDALGRRVEQSSSAGTTRYVNLGANVVAEYDGSNTLRASYVTTLGTGGLPGTPLEANTSGRSTYPLLDDVGSVTGITDASGNLSSFSYTGYGQPLGASSGTYAYGTYGYDRATGLYYARARYYDPGSGRFLSEDPLVSGNLYGYATSDPVLQTDPTGELAAEYSETEAKTPEEVKLLAQQATDDIAGQSTEQLIEQGSDKMKDFIARNPDALRRACGTIIHQLVGKALSKAGFEYLFRGPDLMIMIGGETFYFEITTPGGVAEHLRRGEVDPRYLVAEFIFYVLVL